MTCLLTHNGKQCIINPCIKKKLWSQLHNKQRGLSSCTCLAQNKPSDERLWGWFVEGIYSLRSPGEHKELNVPQTNQAKLNPFKVPILCKQGSFSSDTLLWICLQSQYDSMFPGIWILTCYTEMNKWARLVLPILFIDRLDIVASCIGCWCRKDHQLILQCDGSI